ncbi:MAG TPA: hypothetical protein VF940_28135 [Streptosporangiaceae bacterium]
MSEGAMDADEASDAPDQTPDGGRIRAGYPAHAADVSCGQADVAVGTFLHLRPPCL